MIHLMAILFGALLWWETAVVQATVYWASPAGSSTAICSDIDSSGTANAPGTDPGSYGTIGRAAQCATVAGDVVNIKSGTYSSSPHRIDTAVSGGTVTASGLASGTSESVRTYIQGDPNGARPLIQGFRFYCTFKGASRNYITIRYLIVNENNGGGTCAGTLGIEGHHVTVTDVELSNALNNNISVGTSCVSSSCTHLEAQYFVLTNSLLHHAGGDGTGYGVYTTSNNATIERNTFYNFKGYAIHAYSDFGPVSGSIIRYNYIHDALRAREIAAFFGCNAVVVTGSASVIARNIVDLSTCEADSDPSSAGVIVGFQSSASAAITHNIIYKSRGYGIRIGATPTGAQTIYNNVLFGNIRDAISISPSFSGLALYTNNACEATTTCATSGKVAIAALTDITASLSDFTHRAGSVGIDAGRDIGEETNGLPDLGPFEVPTFSACIVPSTEASSILVSFNNMFPPMLPTAGATTFTARKNSAANPVVGTVSRISNSTYKMTLTNAYANGDQADLSWTAGNVTDSALIGGTLNQKFLGPLVNAACQNNVSGASVQRYSGGLGF